MTAKVTGLCSKCNRWRGLTRHHEGIWRKVIWVCRECHDEIHGMGKYGSKPKRNKKVQKGTPYGKRKKQ